MERQGAAPGEVPNAARMYDYFLGGSHHFAVDREAAERVIARYPDAPLGARANRAFLFRAVRLLAGQGIEQFLDLGSGLPTVGNVHEVARRIAPAARIAYVDIDPIAVALGRAVLGGDPAAAMIEGDLRDPAAILGQPQVRRLLRLDRPLGVLLLAALHFVEADATAMGVVGTLREAVAPGSFVAISHGTEDHLPPPSQERLYARVNQPLTPRSRQQVAQLFEGLELVAPGLVFAPLWQPEGPNDLLLDQPERSAVYAGLGRKR